MVGEVCAAGAEVSTTSRSLFFDPSFGGFQELDERNRDRQAESLVSQGQAAGQFR
jgi:hypothetical protein